VGHTILAPIPGDGFRRLESFQDLDSLQDRGARKTGQSVERLAVHGKRLPLRGIEQLQRIHGFLPPITQLLCQQPLQYQDPGGIVVDTLNGDSNSIVHERLLGWLTGIGKGVSIAMKCLE